MKKVLLSASLSALLLGLSPQLALAQGATVLRSGCATAGYPVGKGLQPLTQNSDGQLCIDISGASIAGFNLIEIASSAVKTGSGTASGSLRVELPTDGTGRLDAIGQIDQPVASAQSGAWTVAATQSGPWTVQPGNTANTTPWLFTVSQGGNSATVSAGGGLSGNLIQLGGTAIDTNSGNKSAGTQRVVLATDQPNLTTPFNTNTAQVAGTTTSTGAVAVGTGSQRVAVGQDTTTVAGATPDPCLKSSASKVSVPISQTANTQLFAGTSAKQSYICSIMIVGADAENVSLVEGTGSVCGTNTVAVIGGATAANGPNLAANGGFVLGSGVGFIAATSVAADNVCLFQSGSGRVAGVLTYVQQ